VHWIFTAILWIVCVCVGLFGLAMLAALAIIILKAVWRKVVIPLYCRVAIFLQYWVLYRMLKRCPMCWHRMRDTGIRFDDGPWYKCGNCEGH